MTSIKAYLLKRPFDFLLSLIGIVLSLPLWIIFSLAAWLEDRGPIFYYQKRVGKQGKVFKAIKFRSMTPNAEEGLGPVQAKENDPRVTRVGKILRATAMDELPQLINILKGDMSFVGPRPLRPNELEIRIGNPKAMSIEDTPGYKKRIAIRPGLTGLAQTHAPKDATRRNKFRYDLLYIKHMSFWLDLRLISLSFWITFKGKWESRNKKFRRRKEIRSVAYWVVRLFAIFLAMLVVLAVKGKW